MIMLLASSTFIFLAAIYADTQLDNIVPIIMYLVAAAASGYPTFIKGAKIFSN